MTKRNNLPSPGVGRRAFLGAASAGAIAVSGSTAAFAASPAPVRVGDGLGGGWTIGALDSDHAGAVVTTLTAADGGTLRVMVCRADRRAHAMAGTDRVHLFLLNDGGGDRPTPDDHVAVVQRLAQRLDGVEASLPGASRLLTSAERQTRFRPIDH